MRPRAAMNVSRFVRVTGVLQIVAVHGSKDHTTLPESFLRRLAVRCVSLLCVGPRFGCSPGPPLRRTAPPPDRPKFRFFSPLQPQFSLFLLSLGGPFVEFWGVFLKRRGPEMCTFGVHHLENWKNKDSHPLRCGRHTTHILIVSRTIPDHGWENKIQSCSQTTSLRIRLVDRNTLKIDRFGHPMSLT